MTRRTLIPLTLAGAILATTLVAEPAQRDARERQVAVSVLGRGDVPATELDAADVVVREDDIVREVLRVAPAPPPSHVALLIDDSQASDRHIAEIRLAFRAFARSFFPVTPMPQMAVMTFGERPTRTVPFSQAPAVIERGIDRVFARPGSGAYLMDAILEISADLRKAEARWPVIVAFVIEDGPEFSQALHQRVDEALRSAGASLWLVVLQGREGSLAGASTEARERARVIADSTIASGGQQRVVLSSQGLSESLTRVADVIGARHLVTYARPEALIPPERLSVSHRRDGLRVLAPQWTGR